MNTMMQSRKKIVTGAILTAALLTGMMLGGCGAKTAAVNDKGTVAGAEKNAAVETTEVTVENVWVDNNNETGFRPATKGIVYVLYANGNKVESEDENFGHAFVDTNYTYTFTDLPVEENGKPIVYTVGEADIDNYYSPAMVKPQELEEVDGKYFTTITTTIRQKEINMKVALVWENEPDNTDEVTVQLLQDENLFDEVQTVQQKAAFEKLPMYDINGDGHKYSYKLREINVHGYAAKYTQDKDADGTPVITISNTATGKNAESAEGTAAEVE